MILTVEKDTLVKTVAKTTLTEKLGPQIVAVKSLAYQIRINKNKRDK